MSEYEIIKHQKIRGLSIFLNAVNYRNAHEHAEWELILVLDNPMTVLCDNTQTVLTPGQMVLFSPHELHELRTQGSSCTFLCIQMSPVVLPILPHQTLQLRFPHLQLPEEALRQVRSMCAQAADHFFRAEPRYELFCMGQCMLILNRLLDFLPLRDRTPAEITQINQRNARIQRMMRYVEKNYMGKLSLAELAREEGCSVSHLSRLIKTHTNQTFQEYVTYVRFVHACIMIAGGDRKMLDVCVDCGFSDYRYFTKAFRQYLNMTPEAYSRRGQQAHSAATLAHTSYRSEHIFPADESRALLKTYLP